MNIKIESENPQIIEDQNESFIFGFYNRPKWKNVKKKDLSFYFCSFTFFIYKLLSSTTFSKVDGPPLIWVIFCVGPVGLVVVEYVPDVVVSVAGYTSFHTLSH